MLVLRQFNICSMGVEVEWFRMKKVEKFLASMWSCWLSLLAQSHTVLLRRSAGENPKIHIYYYPNINFEL